jgi:two-component system sensor histidine kinase CssS
VAAGAFVIPAALTIIFLFISVFAGFIFIFLAPAVDRFSETEMFSLLHNSQENIISYLKSNDGAAGSWQSRE